MCIHKAFIRCVVAVAAILVAVAAILTPATAVASDETDADATRISHNGRIYNGDILYKVINNTSTPTPEGGDAETQPEGLLIVDCNYSTRNHRVLKDTTKDDIICAMLRGETDPFTYSVWITSAAGGSEKYTSETEWDCRPGEKKELTFTGSGTSVTFSSTCTGTAYADMDDD